MPNMGQLGEAFRAIDPDLLARAHSDVAGHIIAIAKEDWSEADFSTLQAGIEKHAPILEQILAKNLDRIEMVFLLPESEEKSRMKENLSGIQMGILVAGVILGKCVELEEIQEGSQR